MAEVIDLTVSPPPEIIEISSDQGNTPPGRRNRTQENKKRKRKKGKARSTSPASASVSGSAQPSRAHSPEIGNKHNEFNESAPHHRSASPPLQISSSTTGEPGLFIIDGAAAPIVVEDSSPTPERAESNGDGDKLLLPSHVAIFRDDGPIPAEVLLPPKPTSDDEEYIEYLDYEDRKVCPVVFVI